MTNRIVFAGLVALVLVAAGCTNAPLPEDSSASADMRDEIAAAILEGDTATVEKLLGTQPLLATAPHPTTSQTPLHLAAQTGNAAIIQLLLDNGADKYQVNDEGETPLNVAERSEAGQAALDLLQ